MIRSSSHLLVYWISLQQVLHMGQATVLQRNPSDPLEIDQAHLTVSNKNHSDAILVMFNIAACEHCDFFQFAGPLSANSSQNRTIDIKYPFVFRMFSTTQNLTLPCEVDTYRFSENGSYLLEISQVEQNRTTCSIVQTGESSYYWTPIIVGIVLLCGFIVFIQVCHCIYNSQYVTRLLTKEEGDRIIIRDIDGAPTVSTHGSTNLATDGQNEDILTIVRSSSELPLVGSTRLSNNSIRITKVLPKRLRALDTFRGFALMVMIFVNYGGGGYWFFNHSVWNGITLADLVFPWFVWMMGVSIVLSQRSLRGKMRKRSMLLKICRRTATLFLLGLILQGGGGELKDVRILGVLQRLSLCYFFTAVLVLVLDEESHSVPWPIGHDVHQPIRAELYNTIFQFWPQWLCIFLVTGAWTAITFIPTFDNCPRGYVGPGGKHEHGQFPNCTGGMAGYIDRLILGSTHMYDEPTCKDVYNTQIPFDPEGLLGILTGVLLCYLGAQAGHSFAHSTRIRRVCAQWIVSGLICGAIGLVLSKGGQSDSWVPINKNLWSLSFVLVLASFAFIILTILYLLVDVSKYFNGEPWVWLGMNSIVVFVGHELLAESFPVQFQVEVKHAKLLAMHAYGATFWMIVAGIMYYKKVFIAI